MIHALAAAARSSRPATASSLKPAAHTKKAEREFRLFLRLEQLHDNLNHLVLAQAGTHGALE
jgi:hypothetical protein